MVKLLITDLDDTLYSWLGFFIPAFYGMVEELASILGKDKEVLLQEYKRIHQEKGSVEYPFATIYLPAVLSAYPNYTQEELKRELNPVFYRFNHIRKRELHLYPQVKETLEEVSKAGIKIVGYTESAEENGFYRLKKLGIAHLFERVYVSNSSFERPEHILAHSQTTIVEGKKPNPQVLDQICRGESVSTHEVIYVGDSMTKDIYMAKSAGITSVLCEYPCEVQATKELYEKLVAISHWTETDFLREKEIKKICQDDHIRPDYTICAFDQLLAIIQKVNSDMDREKVQSDVE